MMLARASLIQLSEFSCRGRLPEWIVRANAIGSRSGPAPATASQVLRLRAGSTGTGAEAADCRILCGAPVPYRLRPTG
jgi:hypothetical protein